MDLFRFDSEIPTTVTLEFLAISQHCSSFSKELLKLIRIKSSGFEDILFVIFYQRTIPNSWFNAVSPDSI